VAGAWASLLLGLLAGAVLPAAIVASRYSERIELLHAGLAIPVAVVLAVAALLLARRARRLQGLTLGRRGRRPARLGRALAVLALLLAVTATISVAFYRVLVEVQ
jgi:hypothetical protein